MSKVTETIGDRVGGYNFSPALFASGSRRKQCPLYSAHPMGITESSFLGCAGSDRYSKDWSPSSLRARQHKPNDSARVGTGQSSFRGRVRCQSHFIAWERRRCEPGSNSVIVTITLTRVRGACFTSWRRTTHAEDFCRLSEQSAPSGTSRRGFETPGLRLLVTGSIHYTIKIASAVSRGGANPRPFTRPSPLPRWERARVRVTPQTTPVIHAPRPFHASTTTRHPIFHPHSHHSSRI